MEFEQILKKYRYVVDRQLNKFFDHKIKNINDKFLRITYGHLKEFVLRPGKRIRPIATIIAYKSIKDGNEENIYPASIVPELFHASSLIHDDIMDEDLLRRNKPTVHRIFEIYFKDNFKDKKYKGFLFDSFSKRFSTSMAIIQGNILYSLSYSAILEAKLNGNLKNKCLEIFNKAYCKTNEGQIFDLLLSSKEAVNEKNYFEMAAGKTSFPLSAAILFGALLNNAKLFQLKNLEKYTHAVGIAFQIHDDVMDLSKTMNKGRELGTDLRRGNKTLMIIKALQNSDEKQKRFLLKILGNNRTANKDIGKAIDIIKATGGIDYADRYSNKKVKEAKEHLKKANLNNLGQRFFSDFADYVVERKA